LGKGTILLGQVVFNASLAMLIIRARFVGMGDTLEEAAHDLGSGPLSTFRQITLPRLMPAIVAAALLSFTFSFDDYVLPAFTNGTTNTWPIVLYSAVRFGITPAVNALATIMLGITVVAVLVTGLVLRRGRVQVRPGEEPTRGLGAALGLR
jgi:ABC-type spermidine/putrescine transport system permease subunit II